MSSVLTKSEITSSCTSSSMGMAKKTMDLDHAGPFLRSRYVQVIIDSYSKGKWFHIICRHIQSAVLRRVFPFTASQKHCFIQWSCIPSSEFGIYKSSTVTPQNYTSSPISTNGLAESSPHSIQATMKFRIPITDIDKNKE